MTNRIRRTILMRAAAVTALGPIATVVGGPTASAADASSEDSGFEQFLRLSAALTGIRRESLMHITEPLTALKLQYFLIARAHRAFGELLGAFRAAVEKVNPPSGSGMADVCRVMLQDATSDTRYLARSVILLWYLGAWYDPDDLATAASSPAPTRFFIPSELAYTQGWVWKVAQAHPAGYSELQFGYWAAEPSADALNLEKFMVSAG